VEVPLLRRLDHGDPNLIEGSSRSVWIDGGIDSELEGFGGPRQFVRELSLMVFELQGVAPRKRLATSSPVARACWGMTWL